MFQDRNPRATHASTAPGLGALGKTTDPMSGIARYVRLAAFAKERHGKAKTLETHPYAAPIAVAPK